MDSWTLAVAPSGRMFLALEGDDSYQAQIVETNEPQVSQNVFPTAAQVFGTSPQKSVFGSQPPPSFQFGGKPPKLQFGIGATKPEKEVVGLFKFGSGKEEGKPKGSEEKEKEKEKEEKEEKGKEEKGKEEKGKEKEPSSDKPAFSMGSSGPARPSRVDRKSRRRASRSRSPSPSTEEEEDDKEEEGESKEESSPKVSAEPPPRVVRQALSPAVAECQRAIFAAFLWQEGLVHDSMASATYLKFHTELTKEMRQDLQRGREKEKEKEKKDAVKTKKPVRQKAIKEKKTEEEKEEVEEQKEGGAKVDGDMKEKVKEAKEEETPSEVVRSDIPASPSVAEISIPSLSLPPTLNYLVTLWDEISGKVLENSALPFPPPKIPALAQEIQKRYEEERKEIEKRKKEKEKKSVPAAGGGATVCELCEQGFPDPVTYHMKDSHPGCGKHASGWGYNSRGTFCSGWAGNCGDGGRGGSTWYLMCKDCHAKYLAMKDEAKKKGVKAIPMPKMKTKKPGKPRSLPVISSVQGMIHNAKFLLEISCGSEAQSLTKPQYRRQVSVPEILPFPVTQKQFSLEAPVLEKPSSHRPLLFRSVSMAVGTEKQLPKRTQSVSGEEESVGPQIPRQHTLDQLSPEATSPGTGSLMSKPSINLARLMYNRSKQGPDGKETGYSKVIRFVLRYHDLDGIRVSMKQAMRVAGVRAFALEVKHYIII